NRPPQRREIVEHVDGRIAQPLVLAEMTVDEDQVRAQLARPPPRHAAAHSESFGLIRGGEHDSAADGDGLAAQGWIEQLLDRCVEGIEVGMENGGCRFHPDRSAKCPKWSMRTKEERKVNGSTRALMLRSRAQRGVSNHQDERPY